MKEAIVGLTVQPNFGAFNAVWDAQVAKMRRDVASIGIGGAMGAPGGVAGGGARAAGPAGGGRPPGGGAPGSWGMAGLGFGWERAGGFTAAFGTVTKFWASYRLMDLALRSVAAPLNAMSAFVKNGAEAWIVYDEAMASAARTMMQPGLSTDWLKRMMGREALDFTTKYRVSIQEVAAAMYELGSTGFEVSTVLQSYQTVLKASIALESDVTQTSRFMTQALKLFGKQMGENTPVSEKVLRIAAATLKVWQIEQVELAEIAKAMDYVTPSAVTLNLKFEELIATVGFLATYGARGTRGGTGLNQFLVMTARNIRVSKDNMLELEKATKGMTHRISLGIKPGELVSPQQLVIGMAKALSQMPKDLAGRMKALQVLNDMLNVRGGRPGALLAADMERLAEWIKKTGDMASWTTAQMSAFLQKMVDLKQNTMTGQLIIMNNQLDVMGIKALQAATGTHTFAGALKEVNQWLRNAEPGILNFARGLHVAGQIAAAAAVEIRNVGKWAILVPGLREFLGIKGAVAGYRKGMRESFLEQMAGELTERYAADIKKGVKPEEAQKRHQTRIDWLKSVPPSIGDIRRRVEATGQLPPPPGKPRGKTFAEQFGPMRKAEEEYLRGAPEASAAEAKERADAAMKPFRDAMAQYEAIEKAPRGAGGTAGRFRDLLAEITDRLLPFETAVRASGIAVEIQQESLVKLNRTMEAGVTTTDLLRESDLAASDAITARKQHIADLLRYMDRTKIAARESEAVAKTTTDPSLRLSARRQADRYALEYQETRLRVIKERNQMEQDRQEQLFGPHVQARIQQSEIALSRHERTMRGYSVTLRDSDTALAGLDAQERVFGETIGTITQKMQQQEIRRRTSLEAMDNEKKRLAEIKRQWDLLLPIWEMMSRGIKLGPRSEADVTALMGISTPTFTQVGQRLDWLRGQMQSGEDAVRSYADTIRDASFAIPELGRQASTLMLERNMERLRAETDATRQVFGLLGQDWDTSAERARNLDAEIRLLVQQFRAVNSQLAEGQITVDQWIKAQEEIMRRRRIVGGERDQVGTLREDLRMGWHAEMRRIELESFRGTPREMARARTDIGLLGVQERMRELRRRYPEEWAKGWLDAYEKTLTAQALAAPWLEARDRIESEWTQMFQEVFSEMVSGGQPLRAFESLFKSIQGQVISGWVRRSLGPLFDVLATEETGIPTPVATQSVALGANTFATQANTAAILAMTGAIMSGGATGGKFGGGVVNLLGMAAGTTSAGGGPGAAARKQSRLALQAAQLIRTYSIASMYAGVAGQALGRESESSAVGGGIGYTLAKALFPGAGPLGWIAGGLAGILGFGKKRRKPKPEEAQMGRDIYGMPTFEWESYLYNLYQHDKNLGAMTTGGQGWSAVVDKRSVGQIIININGGDIGEVKKTVDAALSANFGALAKATVTAGRAM